MTESTQIGTPEIIAIISGLCSLLVIAILWGFKMFTKGLTDTVIQAKNEIHQSTAIWQQQLKAQNERLEHVEEVQTQMLMVLNRHDAQLGNGAGEAFEGFVPRSRGKRN